MLEDEAPRTTAGMRESTASANDTGKNLMMPLTSFLTNRLFRDILTCVIREKVLMLLLSRDRDRRTND